MASYIKPSIMPFKPLVWLDDSRKRVRDFPTVARQRAGFELWEVQQGNDPSDWKPMPSVGPGACEIRVRDEAGAFRVIYVARFEEAVYVLHAFQKKSTHGIKTPQREIDLIRERLRRLKEMLR